jgi:hypothetical protein
VERDAQDTPGHSAKCGSSTVLDLDKGIVQNVEVTLDLDDCKICRYLTGSGIVLNKCEVHLTLCDLQYKQ